MNQKNESKFFTLLHYDPPINEVNPDESNQIKNRFTRKDDASHNIEVFKYIQSIREVDREIGRLIKVINEQNLLNDTIVIMTSDHGYELDDYQTDYTCNNRQ